MHEGADQFFGALKKEKITYKLLSKYARMRSESEKIGLDIDHDLPYFVELMDTIGNKFGFDVEQIIPEFQDLKILELKKNHLLRDVNELQNHKIHLMQTNSALQRSIEFHTQGLHEYRESMSKGLGLNKLKILNNAISEIARESGITEYAAVEQFFKKIEKMYRVNLDDPFNPTNPRSVYAAMSERVNLYFYPENE